LLVLADAPDFATPRVGSTSKEEAMGFSLPVARRRTKALDAISKAKRLSKA